jgi:UTP--glucose-1-phosphate uridylyltransferase
VAGKGTRFLPATKASPKEMLPVVDKPLIQYAVEEAIEAGATNLVFITGRNKRAIEDHFDVDPELELLLQDKDKESLARHGAKHGAAARELHLRTPGRAAGLGHAVLCARPVVGDQPFFVHLADDLIDAEEACLAQMARVFSRRRQRAGRGGGAARPDAAVRHHRREPPGRGLRRLRGIVEKPHPADAPSNLAWSVATS